MWKNKGRTCADGFIKSGHISSKDASPPTIYLEALMPTLVMDVYEGCDVAIFDAPGAYLNADIPNEKYIRIKL